MSWRQEAKEQATAKKEDVSSTKKEAAEKAPFGAPRVLNWPGQSFFFLLKVGTRWNDSSINQQRVSILLGKSILQRVSTPQNPSMKWDAIMEMGVIHVGFVRR